jgi:uncharacterized membrane-anchored protein
MLSKGIIAAVFLLSLAVWLFFYVLTPRAPLGPAEMTIVVAVVGAMVLGARWLFLHFQKRKTTT